MTPASVLLVVAVVSLGTAAGLAWVGPRLDAWVRCDSDGVAEGAGLAAIVLAGAAAGAYAGPYAAAIGGILAALGVVLVAAVARGTR